MKDKEAGGEIISRLLGAMSRPFVSPARSRGIQQAVQQGLTNRVNVPLENVLRRSGMHSAIRKAYEVGMTPVPGTPKLLHPVLPSADQRRAYAAWKADDVVHMLSNHPDAALVGGAGTYLAPMVPGITESYLAGKHLLGKALEGKVKTAQVMPYQQETQWSCSAACLLAVAAHHGITLTEQEAIEAIGTRPGRGAECDQIVYGARKLGMLSFEFSFESIDQAKVLLDQDIPIICDIQSFNHPGKGHYVVMVSADDSNVMLMDPNTPGNQRTITREDMDDRWWDRAMAPPHDMMPKWGIIVLPSE